MQRAALHEEVAGTATDLLVAHGFERENILPFDRKTPADELIHIASLSRFMGNRTAPEMPAALFEQARHMLEVAVIYSNGTDHVDKDSARRNGVAVFNTEHENTRSVAEHTMGLAYDLLKKISVQNMAMHMHEDFPKGSEGIHEMRGKKIGIVGHGTIGSQAAGLAEANGMDVYVYDPSPKYAIAGRARRLATLEELLSAVNIVSIHVPGGDGTPIIDAEQLKLMKKGSYLINTSRASHVNYEALKEALESEHLAGAGIDVFGSKAERKPFEHVLRGVKGVIITAHNAGNTEEAQENIGTITTEKGLVYLATGNSVGSLTIPELDFGPVQPEDSRILYLHDNVEGALGRFTTALGKWGVNVARTIPLNTREEVGYLGFDIRQGRPPKGLLDNVVQLEDHIRSKVIYGDELAMAS